MTKTQRQVDRFGNVSHLVIRDGQTIGTGHGTSRSGFTVEPAGWSSYWKSTSLRKAVTLVTEYAR